MKFSILLFLHLKVCQSIKEKLRRIHVFYVQSTLGNWLKKKIGLASHASAFHGIPSQMPTDSFRNTQGTNGFIWSNSSTMRILNKRKKSLNNAMLTEDRDWFNYVDGEWRDDLWEPFQSLLECLSLGRNKCRTN